MPIEQPNWNIEVDPDLAAEPKAEPEALPETHPNRLYALRYVDYVALQEALDAGRVDEAALICARFQVVGPRDAHGTRVTALIRDNETRPNREG